MDMIFRLIIIFAGVLPLVFAAKGNWRTNVVTEAIAPYLGQNSLTPGVNEYFSVSYSSYTQYPTKYFLRIIRCTDEIQYLLLPRDSPCPSVAAPEQEDPDGNGVRLTDSDKTSCRVAASVPLSVGGPQPYNISRKLSVATSTAFYFMCVSPPKQGAAGLMSATVTGISVHYDIRYKDGYLDENWRGVKERSFELIYAAAGVAGTLAIYLIAYYKFVYIPHYMIVSLPVFKTVEIICQAYSLRNFDRSGNPHAWLDKALYLAPYILLGTYNYVVLYVMAKGLRILRRNLVSGEYIVLFITGGIMCGMYVATQLQNSTPNALTYLIHIVYLGVVGYLLVYSSKAIRYLTTCRTLLYTVEHDRPGFRGMEEFRSAPVTAKLRMYKGLQILIAAKIVMRFVILSVTNLYHKRLEVLTIMEHISDLFFYIVLWGIFRPRRPDPFSRPAPSDLAAEHPQDILLRCPRLGEDLTRRPMLDDAMLREMIHVINRNRRLERRARHHRARRQQAGQEGDAWEGYLGPELYKVVQDPTPEGSDLHVLEGLHLGIHLVDMKETMKKFEKAALKGSLDNSHDSEALSPTSPSDGTNPDDSHCSHNLLSALSETDLNSSGEDGAGSSAAPSPTPGDAGGAGSSSAESADDSAAGPAASASSASAGTPTPAPSGLAGMDPSHSSSMPDVTAALSTMDSAAIRSDGVPQLDSNPIFMRDINATPSPPLSRDASFSAAARPAHTALDLSAFAASPAMPDSAAAPAPPTALSYFARGAPGSQGDRAYMYGSMSRTTLMSRMLGIGAPADASQRPVPRRAAPPPPTSGSASGSSAAAAGREDNGARQGYVVIPVREEDSGADAAGGRASDRRSGYAAEGP